MKLLFTLISIAFSIMLNAQQIVDTTKVWSNLQAHCQPWGNVYTTDYHKFFGDTLINDTLYKKVWIAEDEDYPVWNFYGAFIREENNKVYYREMFKNEGLIYDFNLSLGDSVFLENSRAAENLWLTLTEIDTVETFDGYRERWKMESSVYSNYDYWIKGIGSESSVLNSGTSVFGSLCGLYFLLCEKEEDLTIYQNPLYETCYYELLNEVENPTNEENNIFTILNNASGTISLKFNDNSEKRIKIYSLSGRLVYQNSTSMDYLNIDLNNNSKGLHIIQCSENGNFQLAKIIFLNEFHFSIY